jgi:putative transposase
MSEKISPGTLIKYGVQMVCNTWGFPRSSFYHSKQPKKRQMQGKKPIISDNELLVAIKATIESSPFSGEGHRKVHAKLQRKVQMPCGRNRVLKLMRNNRLLSPYRVMQGESKAHDGRITTDKPNEMWGTDAAKIFTLEDGWVWFFGVLEHWNAECLGWHLTKQGNRFAAIEAMTQAIGRVFGGAASMVAQGTKLRVDHGSQFLSEGFINQTRYWGISISKGFVREPETNGVIERFHRTFKEQVVHGRHYHSLEDLRRAVGDFIQRYNEQWLLEKLDYHSPLEARELYANGENVLKTKGGDGMRRRPERALI